MTEYKHNVLRVAKFDFILLLFDTSSPFEMYIFRCDTHIIAIKEYISNAIIIPLQLQLVIKRNKIAIQQAHILFVKKDSAM